MICLVLSIYKNLFLNSIEKFCAYDFPILSRIDRITDKIVYPKKHFHMRQKWRG